MYGCITSKEKPCLVLEFCLYLDLLSYVREKKHEKVAEEKQNHTKKEFFIFAWQISHGLQYLAAKQIIHRNIAASNILIDVGHNAKITDFGFSIKAIDDNIIAPITEKKEWFAIETLENCEFSLKTDIWAFGIMLYEMYSFGETPYVNFDDLTELLIHLKNGNRLPKPIFCSDEMYEIMQKCWKADPLTRPRPTELIKYFRKFLERITEGYGYLDLLQITNSRNNNELQRQLSAFENAS